MVVFFRVKFKEKHKKNCSQVRTESSGLYEWPVSQTLSLGGSNCGIGPLPVIHLATVPQKIVVGKIAVKVLFADGVVNTDHSALDEREAGFDGIRVNVANGVFARRMAD